MDDDVSTYQPRQTTYARQSSAPRPSGVARFSHVENNVQYTPFTAHASLARVKSDDPWGIKQPTHLSPVRASQTITEEATTVDQPPISPPVRNSNRSTSAAPAPPSARNSQVIPAANKPSVEIPHSRPQTRGTTPANTSPTPKQESSNCCDQLCRRVNIYWLFFIRPIGILMVLEIGMCAIAVVCSDFGALFQGAWKTWFIMWNLIVITCTSILFFMHLCRFGRGDTRVKLIFLLSEIIYDVMTSLALLLSAVAYLRVSVDPNTSRSYSLSVVIIAGVCGIIASIMFAISAFFAFTVRRNVKYHAGAGHRRRSSTLNMEDDIGMDDDDEYRISPAAPNPKVAPAHSKRLVRKQPTTN